MGRFIGGDLKMRCTHPGCTSGLFLPYSTRERLAELQARRDSWRCSDHDGSTVHLTPDTPAVEVTMVSVEKFSSARGQEDQSIGCYFGRPGRYAGQGRVSGEGWYVLANDFPAGSRLVVSVQVLPPAGEGLADD